MSDRLDEAQRRVTEAEAQSLTIALDGAVLDEASLSRVYAHWKDRGFAIVSADRGERSPAQNKRWRKKLKAAIRAAGFGFIPLDGFWFEEDPSGKRHKVAERSYLVPARELKEAAAPPLVRPVPAIAVLRKAALRWGRIDPRNPQESIILTNPGGPVEFLDPITGRPSFSLTRFAPGKVADIYSRLRKRPGTFVFEGWRFVAPPTTFGEAARRKHEGEIKFLR